MPTIEHTQTEPVKTVILGKFQGAFGGFQQSAFVDLKAAGFTPEVAHKVAFDYGSDIGNAIRNAKDDSLATKVAKAKKGGESRITLSGGGSVQTSRAMSLIRLCQQLANLKKEALINTLQVDEDRLDKNLVEYLDDCQTWASEQTFAVS